jgi:hypothetical protein
VEEAASDAINDGAEMGHRELLLLLGALTVFGVAALNAKRFIVDQNESMLKRQSEIHAISLAQSFIEEAKAKRFDARVTDPSSPDPDDFTNAAALGPEAGEIYPSFDDVDDYDDFFKADSTNLGAFGVALQVGYVQEDNPEVVVNTRTFYKKMSVTVTYDFFETQVTLSYIFGYRQN